MTVVFRPDQLVNCSMNGGSSTPKREIREGVRIAERCAIVDDLLEGVSHGAAFVDEVDMANPQVENRSVILSVPFGIPFIDEQRKIVDEEVQTLIEIGAIVETKHEPN
ncbi:hypothetical protein DPMN_092208, partial [Dreissena polymorpha]